MVFPQDVELSSVLSNRTDVYINENGKLVKVEKDTFYKKYLKNQIEYYTHLLAEFEKNQAGPPQ